MFYNICHNTCKKLIEITLYFQDAKIQRKKQTRINFGKLSIQKPQMEGKNKVNFINNKNALNENAGWFTGLDESEDSDVQKIKENDDKISELAEQVEKIDTGMNEIIWMGSSSERCGRVYDCESSCESACDVFL